MKTRIKTKTDGAAGRRVPVPEQRESGAKRSSLRCRKCGHPCKNASGRRVHERNKHGVIFHAAAVPTYERRRWNHDELWQMALHEVSLRAAKISNINAELWTQMKDRSLNAVKEGG